MTTLRIDQVSKVFRAASGGRSGLTPALRKVSFDIDQGEVVTLIGESGSGKTTLGRIVLRLISASGGTVWFDGSDISGYKGAQLRDYYRHVQGVFQDTFSSPDLHGRPCV
jgi:peptide/nickel transport system ATP-binding protein